MFSRFVDNDTRKIPLPTHFYLILIRCKNSSHQSPLTNCPVEDLDTISFILPNIPSIPNCMVSVIFYAVHEKMSESLWPNDGFNVYMYTLLLCLDISLWKCSKFLLARRGIFAWKCGKNPRHWAVDRTEVTFKVQWGDLSSPKNTPNHSTLAHSEYCLQMEWSPLWCQEPEHLSRVSLSVTYYLLRIVEKIFHQQDWQNKTDFSVTQDYK